MLYRVDVAVKDDPRTWIVDGWYPNHQDALRYTKQWPNDKFRIIPVIIT